MRTSVEIIFDDGDVSEVNLMTFEGHNEKPNHQILHQGSVEEAVEAIITSKKKEQEINQQEVLRLTKDIEELKKILEVVS